MNANLARFLAVIGCGLATPAALRAMLIRTHTERVGPPARAADVPPAAQPR